MSAANVIIEKAARLLILVGAVLCLGAISPAVSAAAVENEQQQELDRVEQLNKLVESQKAAAASENADDNASGEGLQINVVSVITLDDEGLPIGFPGTIFYDGQYDETYVVATAKGPKIVVYGPDLFPTVTFGPGRGVDNPQAIYVDRREMVYVCQGNTETNPARISVYNQAFFPEKQVTFEDIPGAENFIPISLAVNSDGIVYVAGLNTRGILVFDEDLHFLRWLRPVDIVFDKEAVAELRADEVEEAAEEGDGEEFPASEIDLSGIPAELLPQQTADGEVEEQAFSGMGYVKISEVKIDSNDNIYLLSTETSRVYVYNMNEEMLYTIGEKGGSAGKMSTPRGMAIDEKRRAIFLADYMRHTVLIYDLGGRFMYEFGGRGKSPGWFNYPGEVTFNNDNQLIVADHFNKRVQVLDVDFTFRFPLFQVPFVREDMYQPQPMAKSEKPAKYFAPGGFEPGQQASAKDEPPGKMLYERFNEKIL